jgi:hypothetical protein
MNPFAATPTDPVIALKPLVNGLEADKSLLQLVIEALLIF